MKFVLIAVLFIGCGGSNVQYEDPVKCTGSRPNIVCECALECVTTADQITVSTNRNDCTPLCYER